MQDFYAAAVLAECPMLLGRRLMPFSLWHSYALDAFDSPLSRDGNMELQDVILAAWICSHQFEVAIDKLRFHRDELHKDCKAWGKRCKAEDINEAGHVLRRYIAEHCKTPPRVAADGGCIGIPWQLAYYWRLSGGRVDFATQREVWNLPLPWAVGYISAYAVANGDESFLSEEMESRLNEARAAASAESNNGNG